MELRIRTFLSIWMNAKEQEADNGQTIFDNLLLVFVDIQSWWEVPSIAHFCSLFRDAFNLLDFDIEVPTNKKQIKKKEQKTKSESKIIY